MSALPIGSAVGYVRFEPKADIAAGFVKSALRGRHTVFAIFWNGFLGELLTGYVR